MKRDYDLKTLARSYQVGEPLYVLHTAAVKGRCRKLNPTWKGPGVITRKFSDNFNEINIGKKFMTFNHDCLKLCSDRVSWSGLWEFGIYNQSICIVSLGLLNWFNHGRRNLIRYILDIRQPFKTLIRINYKV